MSETLPVVVPRAAALEADASPVLLLADCRAVLAGDLPESLAAHPRVTRVDQRPARRSVAPAASYAVDAVRSIEPLPTDAALFTFAGPAGSCVRLFEPAWRAAPDGRLVGPGFAAERSRRIHPFTLLLALDNQVAATLSLELGLRGPCCSTTGSAAAFADLLPNMALAARTRPVLAVFASAAGRAEDRSRGTYLLGVESVIEGAVALLFSAGGSLARIAPESSGSAEPDGAAAAAASTVQARFAPALEPGLSILESIERGPREASFAIRDLRRSTAFRWSSP